MFFYVKSVLISPMLDASMILEQDLMKKILGLGIGGKRKES